MTRLTRTRTCSIALKLALVGGVLSTTMLQAALARTDAAPSQASTARAPQPPLRSQAELDAWLKANAGQATPLDALSQPAKQRFLKTLRWGEKGLGGFETDDLGWELNREQVRAVLALFDATEYTRMVPDYRPAMGWPKRTAATPSAIEQGFDRVLQAAETSKDQSEIVRTERTHQTYLDAFPLAQLQNLAVWDTRDLLLFLRASIAANLSPTDRGHVRAMESALAEAQRRQLTSRALVSAVQRILLAAGELDQAKALGGQYPQFDLVAIPEVVKTKTLATNTPSWWRLDTANNRMIEEAVDLQPLQLLVLAGCHYSEDAADDVVKDPELAPVFARHAHWIGLPPGTEDIGAWTQWNKERPQTAMYLISSRAQWPMFPEWSMPTYAVVRDGKVIDQTTGAWRNYPEARVALVEMLRRHGLMPPAGGKTASPASSRNID